MEITKLHPLVWVFHNAIENPKEIINFYEENYLWEDWFTFGKSLSVLSNDGLFENFPNKEEWDKIYDIPNRAHKENESPIVKKITDSFYKCTKLFFEGNNITLDDPKFYSFNIAKYLIGGKMNHHTDYQQEQYFIPGVKFHTTAVFYLNDNYTGGEISFLELDENQNIIWQYDYKPKAGDLVVFSGKEPIYHGVNEVTNGEKYIIRLYWRYDEKPSEEWNKGVLQYGIEEWEKMQKSKAKDLRTKTLQRKINGRVFDIQYAEKNK